MPLLALSAQQEPMNLLLITVDDMSCDSVGVYGSKLEGTTPVMDRLASQSLRFEHAHVTVGNCNPCRNVMFSGLISHNNKVEGFYKVPDPGWPHMVDLLKDAGYYAGIHGKVSHSSPYQPYAWDDDLTISPSGKRAHVKDAKAYGASTSRGIEKAKRAGKPFFLSINISDPHKPFWTQVRGGGEDPYVPSRIFTADEVPVPGFLFEDPEVQEELTLYYSSVRQGDDCLAQVLQALRDSGEWENTMVVFFPITDALPFAKTQLYHHGTRTPLMVRVPGSRQRRVRWISGTWSQWSIFAHGARCPGNPILPPGRMGVPFTLRSREKKWRVGTTSSNNTMRTRADPGSDAGHPDQKFLYLFNPWSNGERIFATATNGTVTCKRMIALAEDDEEMNQRAGTLPLPGTRRVVSGQSGSRLPGESD